MRPSVLARHFLAAVSCVCMLAACETGDAGDSAEKKGARRHQTRVAPAAKPEVTSPGAYKTCTETFGLEVGSDRYKRCIGSLSELEAK